MALIVEDGSIVPNADTFVTASEYATYMQKFGYASGAESAQETALRKAVEFMNSYEPRLIGSRVSRSQTLCYPRSGVTLQGFDWASDEIPTLVKTCQMEIAIDIQINGADPYNVAPSSATPVKREHVEGAVEVEYAVSESSARSSRSTWRAMLQQLMNGGGSFAIPLLRA